MFSANPLYYIWYLMAIVYTLGDWYHNIYKNIFIDKGKIVEKQ